MKIHAFALGPFRTNSYVVEDDTSGEALLVDPTIASESIYDEIVAHHWKIPVIVNTHGHVDHVYGDGYFKGKTGAQLAIHKDDAPWLETMGGAARFGLAMPAPVSADRLLSDGDTVTVGGLSFEVIHTPGHTAGGICLYSSQSSHDILISGDTLFAGSIGRTDLPGGDYDQLIDSIQRRLLVLPDDTIVYSGHGEATTIGEEKDSNPFLR